MRASIAGLILLLCISLLGNAQTVNCGYKSKCICDYNFSAHSYGDIVFTGEIIAVDTLPVSEVITEKAGILILNDDFEYANCALEVFENERVLRATIVAQSEIRGEVPGKSFYLLTPLAENSCAFKGFAVGRSFQFTATENSTADIYFLWTMDREDYFELKPEYRIWTNKCQPNLVIK